MQLKFSPCLVSRFCPAFHFTVTYHLSEVPQRDALNRKCFSLDPSGTPFFTLTNTCSMLVAKDVFLWPPFFRNAFFPSGHIPADLMRSTLLFSFLLNFPVSFFPSCSPHFRFKKTTHRPLPFPPLSTPLSDIRGPRGESTSTYNRFPRCSPPVGG